MSRGNPLVLLDLLVRKLRFAENHSQFLACVEKMGRYFTAFPGSNHSYLTSVCKGVEILFKGKVNGKDRKKV